ncbi:MAG: putative lipopolysaccharide heptosyltransferase III [Gammaproteobacteria bacterium]|nr:putative lipopolysaccharide heptosyltransferase III [Gammaproteobacteria bacterium]MDH3370685.1 putative lipopolysaccharide heptosyltransferase III [Gammaproteobacteria bacterium]MDH3406218.1 putative lipopolysaccharide heptosyltransferase III [Gammaproteobacteria bacterium]MDH3562531.1 putative lipopolysaccharide heptosyltransferase III [Gammaproteobacteria bacterium]
MLKDAVDLSTLHRVLVIKLRHLGDVLLTSPVFTVLKNHAPSLEIDALVYRDTEPMLSGHPAIANVFTIDRGWKQQEWTSRLAHEWRLLRSMRARQYDLIIHLTENARGAILSLLLKPPYSVARDYRAKRNRLWRNSFTHLYPSPARRHTVEMHLDALRRIGVQPRADERGLTLVPGAEAERSVRDLLARHGLTPKGFIQLHPTSRWMFKSWETEKNAALISALQEAGESIVLTAAPSEPELQFAARITTRLRKPVVDLAGKLNLKQLAALTAQAKCFVGVDSVPMHIAAAMQTPTVVLFGPSGEFEWGPWQVPTRVLISDHPCRPCGQDGCGGGKISDCLTDISVDEVMKAIRQLVPGL